MAGKNIHLLVIDPQNDFCDPKGSLFVQGADSDMVRLSAMIDRLGGKLDDIHVTVDSHQMFHIAHPLFWVDRDGNPPAPLVTMITHKDVLDGVWQPKDLRLRDWALFYTEQLEKNARYVLVIWPYHCIIGSWGHGLVPCFSDAINKWAVENTGIVSFVPKGSNWKTEHYSAVQADVIDPDDPTTQLNDDIISAMSVADIIPVGGEALDFCFANTMRDIIAKFGDENAKKFVILTDACSNVNAPTLEHLGPDFMKEMIAKGVQTSTTVDFLAAVAV